MITGYNTPQIQVISRYEVVDNMDNNRINVMF